MSINYLTMLMQLPSMIFCLRHPFHPNATSARVSGEEYDSVSRSINVTLVGTVYIEELLPKVLNHRLTNLYSFYAGRCEVLEVNIIAFLIMNVKLSIV